jgi:dihydrofolate synthase / folylpolyglutamate synthase
VSLNLQDALERLYGLERRRDKLGLDGTRALLEALGHPERRFRSVHVAGTNGKGSACALIERVLRAAGVRTGLFTSPHLVDFRERIRIDGHWADDAGLEQRLEHLQSLPSGRDRTFFEVATALGFDAFAGAQVEWAVVEVGLGGRLDTTNVLEPAVTVVTSIGLDHTEILGDTIGLIAAEKAGIAKRGTPMVSGAEDSEARSVIAETTRTAGASLIDAAERVAVSSIACDSNGAHFQATVAPWGTLDLSIGMRGRHQIANARVALAALSVLAQGPLPIGADAVRRGFAAARWPGRLEPCAREPRLWWDGAHNPDGLRRLVDAWRSDLGFEPPGAMVLTASRDKPVDQMLAALHDFAATTELVITRSRNARAADPEVLGQAATDFRVAVAPDVPSAVGGALARTGDRRVLLAGSLFAVGEAMAAFGGAPGEVE